MTGLGLRKAVAGRAWPALTDRFTSPEAPETLICGRFHGGGARPQTKGRALQDGENGARRGGPWLNHAGSKYGTCAVPSPEDARQAIHP